MPPSSASPAATAPLSPVASNPLFGPYGEPSVGIIAGDPGEGKSTALLFSFAGPSLFGALPGALKPCIEEVGWSPMEHKREIRLTSISALTALFSLVARVKKEGPKSKVEEFLKDLLILVGDDASLLMQNEKREIDRSPPRSKKTGQIDNFEVWELVKRAWSDMIVAARTAEVHAWFSSHLTLPDTDEIGNALKGGPTMPSKALTQKTPHFADVIWITRPAPWPDAWWKHAALCENGSGVWHTKDRHGWEGMLPLNPAESLRAVGYQLPRPKELPWMEDVVELVAQRIAQTGDVKSVCLQIGAALIAKGYDRRHVRWAVHRDGVDRWRFRTIREAKWKAFGL